MGIPDLLLLPKKFYNRLTGKKGILFPGIILIGTIDIILPYISRNFSLLFTGKQQNIIIINGLLTIMLVIAVGFIDIIFFSQPLFDLFKRFKVEKSVPTQGSAIKIMKIYIIAHLIILPVNLLFYFVSSGVSDNNVTFLYAALYINLIILIWFSAVISRGINAVYSFEQPFRRLVFITVLLWNFLLTSGLEYIISNWLMKLYK